MNPALIGGFTLGALALLVIALLVFGAGKNFNADKMQFVVYFDSSLNGLDLGAPVKLQGVKIGQVKEISLYLDQKHGKIYKPVVLEIDRTSLSGTSGGNLPQKMNQDQRKANRDRLVALGMRARLETQSLLTGLLYVDLNFYPDKEPMFVNLEHNNLLEIPGIPTTTEEIRNTAEAVAQKLRTLPLDQIVQDFSESLHEIKTLLSSEDAKRSNIALATTLEEIEKTSKTLNQHLEPLLRNIDDTFRNTNTLMQETQALVKVLQTELPVLITSSDKTMSAATAALKTSETSVRQMAESVGPESTLSDTLISVKRAAQSIRELSDYLERHPESLLRGKQP